MSDVDFSPGMLCIVAGGALIRLVGSESMQWTEKHEQGLVLCVSHVWRESGVDDNDSINPDYLVLLNNQLYYVPGDKLMDPNKYMDPGRLFRRLSS